MSLVKQGFWKIEGEMFVPPTPGNSGCLCQGYCVTVKAVATPIKKTLLVNIHHVSFV